MDNFALTEVYSFPIEAGDGEPFAVYFGSVQLRQQNLRWHIPNAYTTSCH